MSKQYKSHAQVPKKYKWDLSFLLEGKTPEQALNSLVKDYGRVIKEKESKYATAKSYLSSLKYEDKLTIKSNKLMNYISNSQNLNVTDAGALSLGQKVEFEMYKIANAIGSEDTRFFKHAAKLAKWAKLPEFKEYKYLIEKKLEEKKYILPKAIAEYNLKVSRGNPDYTTVFGMITDAEIDYGHATSSKGSKVKITRANRVKLSESNDKSIRKTSTISFRNAYLKNKGSLASLLYQHKKTESASLMARGFKSSIEGLIFSDRVKPEFLDVLFSSVKDNVKIFKPYKNAIKKFYKAKFKENITEYDWGRPLLKEKSDFPVSHSIKEVNIALKPFGTEYVNIVKDALAKGNWVDFMSVNNKRSGAYSIGGTYGIDKKLILMNFQGDMRSTETLAHEMGHSMHSYYSDKVQKTPRNSSYPIFLAEIASIFNELMLHDYWLRTIQDKKTRFMVLDRQISGFVATVLRQTQWAEYEYELYNRIDKGEPVGSYDRMAKIYYDVATQYSTEKPKKYNEDKQFAAIYVPHFYYGFYVYKYAIGQLVANIFFAKYKKEGKKALQFYIDKFLSVGGSKNPVDLLKDAGIDLTDPKTYELGFETVKNNIKEYVKLGKDIFKVK